MKYFKTIFARTFCPSKSKNVWTNVSFGRKMSDVQPLFQARHVHRAVESI